eukprot:44084-Amphidinium_carterae.2
MPALAGFLAGSKPLGGEVEKRGKLVRGAMPNSSSSSNVLATRMCAHDRMPKCVSHCAAKIGWIALSLRLRTHKKTQQLHIWATQI